MIVTIQHVTELCIGEALDFFRTDVAPLLICAFKVPISLTVAMAALALSIETCSFFAPRPVAFAWQVFSRVADHSIQLLILGPP